MLTNLSRLYYDTGRFSEAIPLLDHVLRMRRDDFHTLVNLAICHQELGEIFYSQHHEDLWIIKNLVLPKTGIFVDVGAEDGVWGSNTYYFEKIGWTGICIEPNPSVFAELCRARTCQCVEAAIGSDVTLPLYIHPIKGWSGLLDEGTGVPQAVTIRTLDSVLEEAKIEHIDLLSIDTEGTELNVLATFDLEKYIPTLIIVEWNTWNGKIDTKAAIQEYLALFPYTEVLCTSSNLIFARF